MNSLIALALMGFSGWIVVEDARRRQIPNLALLGLIIVWAADVAIEPDVSDLQRLSWSISAFIAIGVPLHVLGWAGGGDVKLTAITILLIPSGQIWTLFGYFYLIFTIHLAVVILFYLIKRRNFVEICLQLRAYPFGIPLAGAICLIALTRLLAGAVG